MGNLIVTSISTRRQCQGRRLLLTLDYRDEEHWPSWTSPPTRSVPKPTPEVGLIPVTFVPVASSVPEMVMVSRACERELCSFMLVDWVARFRLPSESTWDGNKDGSSVGLGGAGAGLDPAAETGTIPRGWERRRSG